jgi:hypothetical protein
VLATGTVVLLLLYTCSYLWISVHGRYEPAIIGLNGVKWYEWAPDGFVDEFKWNRLMMRFFFPMHLLDTRLWHTPVRSDSGAYPINEVAPENIGNVYSAWE